MSLADLTDRGLYTDTISSYLLEKASFLVAAVSII